MHELGQWWGLSARQGDGWKYCEAVIIRRCVVDRVSPISSPEFAELKGELAH